MIPPPPVVVAHVHGCHTESCDHRISERRHRDFPKNHPERYQWRYSTASWYGPGFYGHGMACGGPLLTSTIGVANKTMACGTRLVICFRKCIDATVVDRGPYVAGREFDLTGAAATATGLSGVQSVKWRVKR